MNPTVPVVVSDKYVEYLPEKSNSANCAAIPTVSIDTTIDAIIRNIKKRSLTFFFRCTKTKDIKYPTRTNNAEKCIDDAAKIYNKNILGLQSRIFLDPSTKMLMERYILIRLNDCK